jgi:hypothetical protein
MVPVADEMNRGEAALEEECFPEAAGMRAARPACEGDKEIGVGLEEPKDHADILPSVEDAIRAVGLLFRHPVYP